MAEGAEVADLDEKVAGELVLNIEICLIEVAGEANGFDELRGDGGLRADGNGAEARGQLVGGGKGSEAGACCSVVLKQEGRCTRAGVGGLEENGVRKACVGDDRSGLVVLAWIENGEAAAKDVMLAWGVGETKARTEEVIVKVVGVAALAVDAGESDDAGCAGDGVDGGGVEGVLAVVGEVARGVEIPAEPVVEREARAYTPVILCIQAPAPGDRVEELGLLAAGLGYAPEEQVGQRAGGDVGADAGVVEGEEAGAGGRVEVTVGGGAVVDAEFELMGAALPGDIVGVLVRDNWTL